MSYLSPLDKIKSARVRLIRRHPFYGFLAMYLKPREDKTVSMFSVNGYGELFYNPDYVKNISVEVVEIDISHEILHLALQHHYRSWNLACLGKLKTWEDLDLFFVACDLAVNSILAKEFGESRLISCNFVYDSKFEGMSAEEIYEELKKMRKQGRLKISKLPDGTTVVQYDGHTITFKGHEKFMDAGGKKDKGRIMEEMERKAREWGKRVVEAYEYAKSVGKDPLGIRKIVEAMLKPPSFNWRELLRKFIQDLIPNDYTWLRPHKKSFSTGFYLPAVRKEESIELAIVLDTSGSISDDEYRDFMSEVFHILRSFRSVKAHFIMCDAEVAKTFDCENVEDAVKMLEERAGYGGTSFIPAFNYIHRNLPQVRAVIYLTDLYTSGWPERLEKPTLFVVCKEGAREGDKYWENARSLGALVIKMK